jgi:hypothetical protein
LIGFFSVDGVQLFRPLRSTNPSKMSRVGSDGRMKSPGQAETGQAPAAKRERAAAGRVEAAVGLAAASRVDPMRLAGDVVE